MDWLWFLTGCVVGAVVTATVAFIGVAILLSKYWITW